MRSYIHASKNSEKKRELAPALSLPNMRSCSCLKTAKKKKELATARSRRGPYSYPCLKKQRKESSLLLDLGEDPPLGSAEVADPPLLHVQLHLPPHI